MNLKDRWNKKKNLRTETFKFLGQDVKIREITGLEKKEIDEISKKDSIKAQYGIWDKSMQTEGCKMTEEEFNNAYEYSHPEVDYIMGRMLDLSGLSEEAKKSIEKN